MYATEKKDTIAMMLSFERKAIKSLNLWLPIAVTFSLVAVYAQEENNPGMIMENLPTPEEFRILPSYCRIHQNIDGTGMWAPEAAGTPERKKWQVFFGESYIAMHHYCWALNWVNRANSHASRDSSCVWICAGVSAIGMLPTYHT